MLTNAKTRKQVVEIFKKLEKVLGGERWNNPADPFWNYFMHCIYPELPNEEIQGIAMEQKETIDDRSQQMTDFLKIYEDGQKKLMAEQFAQGEARDRAEGEARGEARGRAEGEARGRAEGEARGRAEGEARGRAEGEARGQVLGQFKAWVAALKGIINSMHVTLEKAIELINAPKGETENFRNALISQGVLAL